jgi:hypothetical protein
MGDGDRTLEMVRGAGFDQPRLEEIAFTFSYSSFDDLWDSLLALAGPLARVIKSLPEEERSATRAALEQNMVPFGNHDGSYACPASSWGVLAR